MATEGRRFRRRKKEDLFAAGYNLDTAIDASPNVDRQDETFHVFGKDSPELDVQHNFGSLSIAILDKYTNNALLDLASGLDPDSAAIKQYKVDLLTSINMFANVKDQLNSRYVKSWFMQGWTPGLPVPSGDPNAKAQFTVTGNGKLPRLFEGAWIKTKKVASGGAATLGGDIPVEVPSETGIYAVAVQALNAGPPFEQEDVVPSAAMVTAGGSVVFSEIDAQVQDLTTVTHAMVYYLQTGSGVYPNIVFGRLRE
jgi:hypothetical protein